MIRGETVTLIRRVKTGVDADNNDVYTDQESSFGGTVFAPGGSTEVIQGQDQVIATPKFIWVNTIPDLTSVDAIRRGNGDVYEITGDPGDYPSPFTTTRVLEVNVRQVTG